MYIYGPSAGDNPGFFERIFLKIKEVGNDYTIIGGDWNVVLDVNLDTFNYKRMVNRPRSRNKVKEMMTVHELVDPWREIRPEKRRYTWRKFNTTKQGRLDYFLVSEEMLICIKGASSNLIILQSKWNLELMQCPRVNHSGNLISLLRDKCYIDEVKKVILYVKKTICMHY